VKRDGALPHVFDEVEGRAAFLVAHGVPEQAPEQSNVLPQRPFGLRFSLHDSSSQARIGSTPRVASGSRN
jgi:hypothetical protein